MKLAIIPARSGSTRIKDKNIINFCGKPLITYSLQTASESGIFDKIHVSTDSKKYQKLVNRTSKSKIRVVYLGGTNFEQPSFPKALGP